MKYAVLAALVGTSDALAVAPAYTAGSYASPTVATVPGIKIT